MQYKSQWVNWLHGIKLLQINTELLKETFEFCVLV